MYYNARYYDPTTARFNQADTIVPDPTNPADLNRYTYTRNNPVNLTDPTGNYCIVAGPRKGECIKPGDDPGDTGVPGTGDSARRTTRGSGGRGSTGGTTQPGEGSPSPHTAELVSAAEDVLDGPFGLSSAGGCGELEVGVVVTYQLQGCIVQFADGTYFVTFEGGGGTLGLSASLTAGSLYVSASTSSEAEGSTWCAEVGAGAVGGAVCFAATSEPPYFDHTNWAAEVFLGPGLPSIGATVYRGHTSVSPVPDYTRLVDIPGVTRSPFEPPPPSIWDCLALAFSGVSC